MRDDGGTRTERHVGTLEWPDHAVEKDVARMTKILLVDDSKFLRLATERALSRAGYDVSTANDGERALEIAREKKPDVILLDMLLPKMTGPDVLKALKKDPATKGIAVVVLTGLSQKNAVRLQPDGACAFLEKSEWGLDQECETLLAGIVQKLNLGGPAGLSIKRSLLSPPRGWELEFRIPYSQTVAAMVTQGR
jgi:CheY-like chemotaxis protein